MEDGSGISPWSYFFLGSVLFAEAFNFWGEVVGGQNCMFWEMVSEETFTCEMAVSPAVQGI